MYIFKLIYFFIFIANIQNSRCQLSDKRMCVDEKCSVPVSYGRTLLMYASPSEGILSFRQNEKVTIYSKEAGSRSDLWGVEINGKRGYAPKTYIRETKLSQKATLLVDTEVLPSPNVPSSDKESVVASQIGESYQVIDGTTLYDSMPDIAPTSTVSPSVATPTLDVTNKEDVKIKNDGTSQTDEGLIGGVISAFKKDAAPESTETIDNDNDDADDDEEHDGDDIEAEEEEGGGGEHQAIAENSTLSDQETQSKETVYLEPSTILDIPILSPYSQPIDSQVLENVLKETETMSSTESDGKVNEAPIAPDEKPIEIRTNIENADTNIPKILSEEKSPDPKENLNAEKATSPELKKETISQSQSIPEEQTKPVDENLTIGIVDSSEMLSNVEEQTLPIMEALNTGGVNNVEVVNQEVNSENEAIANEGITTVVTPLEIELPTPIAILEDVTNSPPTDIGNEGTPTLDVESRSNVENLVDSVPTGESAETLSESKTTDKIYTPETADVSSDLNVPYPKENLEEGNMMNEDTAVEATTVTNSENLEEVKEKSGYTEPSMFDGWFGNSNTPVDDSKTENDEVGTNNAETPEEVKIIEESKPVLIADSLEYKAIEKAPSESIDQIQENAEPKVKSASDFSEDASEEIVEENGIFSNLFSFFSNNYEKTPPEDIPTETGEHMGLHVMPDRNFESCEAVDKQGQLFNVNWDILSYLVTTAIACIIFLFLYLMVDRSRNEGFLISKINMLEQKLIVTMKENDMLQEQQPISVENTFDERIVEDLKTELSQVIKIKDILEHQVEELNLELEKKQSLEDQIEALEKELETSTEVGMELNRIISEMLDPMNGADKLKENVEQLQRQLFDQKETISTTQSMLNQKETETEALQLDIVEYKKKVHNLESQLEELLDKVVNIEKEKDEQHIILQREISLYQQKFTKASQKEELLSNEIQTLNQMIIDVQHLADLKTKEYNILKEEVARIQSLGDDTTLESLLDMASIKAQLEQLKSESQKYTSQLQQERMVKAEAERKYQVLMEEIESLQRRYDETDKERTEATMKLEVLNNYFKKRESELQEEVLKYKSIFEAKEGAATSTSERIKLMLEEIENYKSQNETLKQEILSQEIDLKSQISVLEKKVHENWVISRQTERKLEDARQEAAQLRNRLTMRERAFIENRLQSPIEQNGETALSPHPPLDSPASPPPLFGTNNRDHITKSPPLTGLPPPPFLPPLPGAPFMPPPLPGMPPFMPPPPNVYPGDHRPPPLGRMSSPPPPLNSRYSPDTSAFSPYERNSPSPYDSEYGITPPGRGYSPYNGRDDRRDYGRQPHSRNNNRNKKGPTMSSGSDHSNESLDKHHRKQSKMV